MKSDNTKNNIETNLFENPSVFNALLFSLISALFFIYPNISIFSLERNYLGEAKQTAHLLFFVFRYLYFSALILTLLWYNLKKIKTADLKLRFLHSLVISAIAYGVYVTFSLNLSPKKEWYSGLLIFQFFVMTLFCALIGYVFHLYSERRKKEQEIEKLKVENLQSRYDALTNQINPHFFFNSLNGLTSLIRKKNDENTLGYVNKLSDVFRYILRSDKKILVALDEELDFVQSFRYMMEVRFAHKLEFIIDVDPTKRDLKIPVLSMLPLIENVVVHNTIDSDHKMIVTILLDENLDLVVSNPVSPKLAVPDTNGTGLKNLESRFALLMKRQIRYGMVGDNFVVRLPLRQE